jgi:PKD repeat protein
MVIARRPVLFTDTSTGNISSSWDFGDGTVPVNGSTASHTYATAGTFRANHTVTSSTGATLTCSQDIVVTDPTTGILNISSIPPGAKIIIDNQDQGKVTPQIIQSIPAGTHSLKLTLSGYLDYTTTFPINPGLLTALNPTLT